MAADRWTRANVRHALGFFLQGANPAAAVYESIGEDFLLAPAPGWLNLGLWEGPGVEHEAEAACRRLVRTLARSLPRDGDVLDVGNGLAAQDPVIAEVARPRSLTVLNITESQLRAGRERLRAAGARAVAADATRMPVAAASVDGVISVEAAFHFRSRRAFFAEAHRVLRPGGVLAMSDVPVQRLPRSPLELAAGVSQLRVWGLRPGAAASAARIAGLARTAGFTDVRIELVGARTLGPAFELTRGRLRGRPRAMPRGQRAAARVFLSSAELLWRRGILDYLLLTARRPG